jgi:hypothetical protein
MPGFAEHVGVLPDGSKEAGFHMIGHSECGYTGNLEDSVLMENPAVLTLPGHGEICLNRRGVKGSHISFFPIRQQ